MIAPPEYDLVFCFVERDPIDIPEVDENILLPDSKSGRPTMCPILRKEV